LALIVDQGRIYRLLPQKRGPTVGCTASDAVYVALWLTTAGSGEIFAHSRLCGWTDGGELSVGFALLGLTVARVYTRLFAAPSQLPASNVT
jgi:hypothetical protein